MLLLAKLLDAPVLAPLSLAYFPLARRRPGSQLPDALVRELHGGPSHTWRRCIHWSFPQTDRRTLQLLYAHAGRSAEQGCALPPELWELVFSHVCRGWFLNGEGTSC